MANSNEELVTRTLEESFLKSVSAREETISRESNAWESFLVGTDGDTLGTKENHTSYLDHIEAVNTEPSLLLGGLSPVSPPLPDRHVRGSNPGKRRKSQNRGLESPSSPRNLSASLSISSPSKGLSSAPSALGSPDETLEEKIARVMSGNYTALRTVIGNVDTSRSSEIAARSPERASARKERDNERSDDSSFSIGKLGDESVMSYETIPLHVDVHSNPSLNRAVNCANSDAFEPLSPLPPRLSLEVPKRDTSSVRGRGKQEDSAMLPETRVEADLQFPATKVEGEGSRSSNSEDDLSPFATRSDAAMISPISKIVYDPSQGPPSPLQSYVNMLHSPVESVSVTPIDRRLAMVEPFYESPVPFTNRIVRDGTEFTASPAARKVSTAPRSKSSKTPVKDSSLPTPTRKRASSGAASLNGTARSEKPVLLTPTPLPSRVVKVAVRVRPFSQAELQGEARRIISHCGDKLVIVNPTAFDADPDTIALAAATVQCKEWAQAFRFNHVLWSHEEVEDDEVFVSQEGVHRAVGAEIVNNVLNGVSASCFAYGHTGTGKTYSLFGKHGSDLMTRPRRETNGSRRGKSFLDIEDRDRDMDDGSAEHYAIFEDSGLIPRILHDVIEGMRMQDPDDLDEVESDIKITFSFLEIYNEKIRDLLVSEEESFMGLKSPTESFSGAPGVSLQSSSLKVREHPVFGPYVEGLTRPVVTSTEDALRLLAVGLSRRSTTQTTWNAHSSRSHAVVTLEISQPSKYVEKKNANGTMDTKSHLLSPTVSFTHSTKNGGGTMSPDGVSNSDVLSQSLTSFPAHTSTGKDADGENRHFVRVQLVDLAGSERDPMQPSRVPRDGDEMDLMASVGTPTRHKAAKRNSYSNSRASMGSNTESFGGGTGDRGGGGPNGASSSSASTNELRMIRRSLSTLGYIIKALGRGEAFKSLPYRDSVLTWLLRDALSGKNHTTMLATLSPAHNCHDESLNTLKYAERLCQVNSKAQVGKSAEGSHGFSPALSSSSKEVSQLRHQQSQQSSAVSPGVRDGYTYEYGAINSTIHDNLGGNRPGTLAARMLLRRTITDPQQRLAKIGLHQPKNTHGTLHNGDQEEHDRQHATLLDSSHGYGGGSSHTPNGTDKNNRNGSSDGANPKSINKLDRITQDMDRERLEESSASMAQELEGLKNAYRSLHGQHIEMEIELEAARTDRDSLMVELKSSQEAVAMLQREEESDPWNRAMGSRSAAAASDMRDAIETGERELVELRTMVIRKESAVDRLLMELTNEKQERTALEQATQSQAEEFLARLDRLQRENDNLLSRLSQSILRSEEVPVALEAMQAESARLKCLNDQHVERTEEYLRMLDEAGTTQKALKADLAFAEGALRVCEGRLRSMEGGNSEELGALKEEVAAITRDRDALISVIDQQEVALQLQNRQSDAAMKALEQRQTALERSEHDVVVAEDELSRLQRGLAEFMSKQGDYMEDDIHDARRFATVISEVRRRLLEADAMHNELEQERTRRLALQHILETTTTAQTGLPLPRSPSKAATRPTHTTATQTTAFSAPTTSSVNTSTTTAHHTTWSQSHVELSESRNNMPSKSHDSATRTRGGTRSHAEVQMRLQAFSNPQTQVSAEHTNTQLSINGNGSSNSSSSSSLINSSSNNSSSGSMNGKQGKIEGSKSHLQSQQQLQFHQLMEQLEQQNRATEASEKRAQYWQHVAHVEQSKAASLNVTSSNSHSNHTSSNTNISIFRESLNVTSGTAESVKAENRRLRGELEHMAAEALAASSDLRTSKAAMQKEVWSSKEELRVSREGMQGELASLWMAVQELNKLDAVKEKKMQELLSDRDRALEAKELALTQLDEMTDNYNELQTELQAIDADLLEAVDAVVESQHYNGRQSQGASPTHAHPHKQLHLHQGIIGSILGNKGSMRGMGGDETRSIDSHNLNMHLNTSSVPGSARSKGTQGQAHREEHHGPKHPAVSPISSSAGLPTLPLRTSQSPSIKSGFNTSSRSTSAAAVTHYHSHSQLSSHNQASSHSASRGAGGGRGSVLNSSGEARATLGEKILEKQISELSEFLDHDRVRLDSQQKRAKMRTTAPAGESYSQGGTPRSSNSTHG